MFSGHKADSRCRGEPTQAITKEQQKTMMLTRSRGDAEIQHETFQPRTIKKYLYLFSRENAQKAQKYKISFLSILRLIVAKKEKAIFSRKNAQKSQKYKISFLSILRLIVAKKRKQYSAARMHKKRKKLSA